MGGTAIDRRRLRTAALAALAGLCYYIETQTLGFTLQCPFHQAHRPFLPGLRDHHRLHRPFAGRRGGRRRGKLGAHPALPLLAPFSCMVPVALAVPKAGGGALGNGTELALAGWFFVVGCGAEFVASVTKIW